MPSPWAAPTEVADFLVRLLLANNVPIERATHIAAKWTLGSGKELRDYPAVMYLDVFGNEDAWVTYPAVQQIVHEEKSEDFWYRNRTSKYHSQADGGRRRSPANVIIDVTLAVMLCFEAIAVFVATRGFEGDVHKCAIMASFFLGMFSLLTIAVAALTKWFTTPQKDAEQDLRLALEKVDSRYRDTRRR